MKNIPVYPLVLVLLVLLLGACKTTDSGLSQSGPSQGQDADITLSAGEEKLFQMAFYDGLKAKTLENLSEARQAFEKALEINPNSGATRYELARIFIAENQYDQATAYAEQALATDPNNPWYGELLVRLYGETGRWNKAITVMRDMIERHPDDYENYFRLSNLLSAQGKHGEALGVLEQIEAQFGPSEDLSMQRQMIYLEQEKYDLALGEVDRMIATHPDELQFMGVKAEILEKAGRDEEANALYRQMLEIDPGNGLVLLALYEDAAHKGNHAEAMKYLNGAFAGDELNIDLKINILLNLMSSPAGTNHSEDLLELANTLEATHPTDPKTYAIKGDLHYGLDNLEESRENFRRAVELDPNRPPIWQQILTIDSRLSDFEAMKEESDQALVLFPMQPVFYMFNGVALLHKESPREAVEILNAGKNLIVDDDRLLGQFLASLGDAYHAMGDHANSDKSYDQALKYNPGNVVVLNNYAYYLALREEHLEKAETMAKKANDLHPDEPGFQDTYAWVLFKRSNLQNALFWIEEALKNGGNKDPVILEHHGDILEALGRTDEAVDAWKAAMERGGAEEGLKNRLGKYKNADE